jgi:alkylation response protein AidB-like acyl-CoA dehydrogenase
MDFTPEQELLRESVRRVCSRHAGLDVVRKMENDPIGYPPALWEQLGELGLLGLTIPEAWGGSGMSMLDGTVVYEELGRALAPTPHFVSCVLAAGVLVSAGSDEQRESWLPRIASGESVVSVAWLEPERGFGPAGVQLRAERADDSWRLSGTKRHVMFARAADRLLVLARTDEGPSLFLLDPDAPGVTLEQQLTVASDTQYRLDLHDVTVGPDALVGPLGGAWELWEPVMRDGIILLAAQAVGGARQALDLTVSYSATRHQFDKPLAAFQAISHYLADASTAVDGAQTLVWQAAWAAAEGRSTARLAPMAKLFACQTFRDVTGMGVQVFGGVGFTLEFDIQLYFRRAKSLQLNWWDSRYLEELIATELLDG